MRKNAPSSAPQKPPAHWGRTIESLEQESPLREALQVYIARMRGCAEEIIKTSESGAVEIFNITRDTVDTALSMLRSIDQPSRRRANKQTRRRANAGEEASPELSVRWYLRRDQLGVLQIEKETEHRPIRKNEQMVLLSQGNTIGIVATLSEHVVGQMIYELREKSSVMLAIGVSRAHRRQGVGEVLLGKMVAKLSPGRPMLLDQLDDTHSDVWLKVLHNALDYFYTYGDARGIKALVHWMKGQKSKTDQTLRRRLQRFLKSVQEDGERTRK